MVKKVLGVGVPQRLVDAEGLALLDRLLVLVDLLFSKLPEEIKAGFNFLDGLRLEHAVCNRPGPNLVPYLGADKDRRPAIWASDRAGRDVA